MGPSAQWSHGGRYTVERVRETGVFMFHLLSPTTSTTSTEARTDAHNIDFGEDREGDRHVGGKKDNVMQRYEN